MVEVGGDDDDQADGAYGRPAAGGEVDDFDDKVPGEDDEPDMGGGHGGLFGAMDQQQEEELIPIKPKHGGLFGADVAKVKY